MCQLCCFAGVRAPHMYAAITQCQIVQVPSHAVQPILVNHPDLAQQVRYMYMCMCICMCMCMCMYVCRVVCIYVCVCLHEYTHTLT